MSAELNLRFVHDHRVVVTRRDLRDDDGSGELSFANPIADKDLLDIQWYVETYGAHSLGDPDDGEGQRIAAQLPRWGKKLFHAVFQHPDAARLFYAFQNAEDQHRLLTISAGYPAILALPWELLHDASLPDGTFLFHEKPSISIRRRVAGALKGREAFAFVPKDRAHLLFVVSRPEDVGFLDPRADAQPVLDAIDWHAPGRVSWEFLRPPTFDALLERLDDHGKPVVDILHFDGHGVFDREGGLPRRHEQAHRIRHGEDRVREGVADTEQPPNTGYLIFETTDGLPDFVSADRLGANLHRHKVALVILSACQSATVGPGHVTNGDKKDTNDKNEESSTQRPMGSVAARLTATGIPSVLAMTHSVLVATTRALFAEFYKELGRRKDIGEALDGARRHLFNHPEKYEVQRGSVRVPLRLQDWFLPALYQQGADGPLLDEALGKPPTKTPAIPNNLPRAPEGGFFGRKRSLWEIERWFAGPTRRITISGFGGQGKTALALEAGRWLTRTGLFAAAVLVDYARVQAEDAAAVAVTNIGTVLRVSLMDAEAATEALRETPTLVILDNLEALAPGPLHALLEAAAAWSTAGESRVLCTTRRPELGHAEYKVEGTLVHRRITLEGLGSERAPDDALEWFAALMKLPPAPAIQVPMREELIALFVKVRFHPLSVRVLAQQLKIRASLELGQRLERLLLEGTSAGVEDSDTPNGLVASLKLSLDGLDPESRRLLPRLGIFQGGAFEDDLVAVTGLGGANGNSATGVWPSLRQQLETAALIEAETIQGVNFPFIRFHPTLAPMLWMEVGHEERRLLVESHRERYEMLAWSLFHEDRRHPDIARAIAWRELPNLLKAVHDALDAPSEYAVEFVDSTARFLRIFGLTREAENLVARAQSVAVHPGSTEWYLAQFNRGEDLYRAGQVEQSAVLYNGLLERLGDTPSFNRASALSRLGDCSCAMGRPDRAETFQREAIAVCAGLEQTEDVKRMRALVSAGLANALFSQGRFPHARGTYEETLKLCQELGDLRSQGIILGQLGTLSMREGELEHAVKQHQAALALFRQLREPETEAACWHNIGVVLQAARKWEEAEQHYREAARIREEHGFDPTSTWNNLAGVSQMAGKPEVAEMWYRKAIAGQRQTGNSIALSTSLTNLADLLQAQPSKMGEARKLLEESLVIARSFDSFVASSCKIHEILAGIAIREADAEPDVQRKAQLIAEAREQRRLARDAKRCFPGTRQELRRHVGAIVEIIAAVRDAKLRSQALEALRKPRQGVRTLLVGALCQILEGERDPDALCADLDSEDSMIVETILQGLEDPKAIQDLVPPGRGAEACGVKIETS